MKRDILLPELPATGVPAAATELIERHLRGPAADFLSRPGKRLRAQLVEAGAELGGGGATPAALAAAADLLEQIHAGSLIIDDIQDRSETRRGEPTLHRRFGLPVALNTGNWLYFAPLEGVRRWNLPADRELRVYRLCVEALSLAHAGQAIDVGTPIDELPRNRIGAACRASIELKSGTLTELALGIGATLAGADDARVAVVRAFGRRFGTALQMFDDLGNLEDPARRFEDLNLRRPSFVWATIAENCSERDYANFVGAVRALPDESFLRPWLALHRPVAQGLCEAEAFLSEANARLERELGAAARGRAELEGLRRIAGLSDILTRAYVKPETNVPSATAGVTVAGAVEEAV